VITHPNPDPAENHPDGVEVRDVDDTVLQTFTGCDDLHGEAATGRIVVFGCADGMLVLTRQRSGTFTAAKLDTPADAAAGARVTTTASAEGLNYYVGNWTTTSLVRIDPRAGTLTPIPVAGTVRGFALSPLPGAPPWSSPRTATCA
jgi:hypothetical protein